MARPHFGSPCDPTAIMGFAARVGTPVEIVTLFGGKPAYLAAIHELETALYQEAA